MCAAECIKSFFTNVKISLEYILVGFKISFFNFLGILFFFKIDLTNE